MRRLMGAACSRRLAAVLVAVVLAAAVLALAAMGEAQAATPKLGNAVTCSGKLPIQNLRKGARATSGQQPNLVISQPCTVSSPGNYYYGTVNIVAGGKLTFTEPRRKGSRVDFWASSIIVENGGALVAGSASAPYGSRGGVLNIFIYGPNQSGTSDPAKTPGQGTLCYGQLSSTIGPCGIPLTFWNSNGATPESMPGAGNISDNFYQYGPNYGDNLCTDGTQWTNGACGTSSGQVGYFCYKVLAVSYGGTLDLFGYKGTPIKKAKVNNFLRFLQFFPIGLGNQGGNGSPLTSLFGQAAPAQDEDSAEAPAVSGSAPAPVDPTAVDADPRDTGFSWMRLAANLSNLPAAQSSSPNTLTLSKAPGDHWWSARDNKSIPDQVVVTTTDYLPGHSELLTISGLKDKTLSFTNAINYFHNGTKYAVGSRLGGNTQRFLDAGMDPDLISNGAETRAAVALLTRSIRIVSAGDVAGETWEVASHKSTNCQAGQAVPYCYYFGANTVFRQGFKQI